MLSSTKINNQRLCSMQKKLLYIIPLIIISIYIVQARIYQSQSVAIIETIFKKENANGTFVIYDVSKNTHIIYNKNRSQHSYYPASTFKIPNSLIGLSTHAVKNVDEVFYKYDGSKLYLPTWEKDMNLREAIKVSQVLAYQELAQRIGLKAMQENIHKLAYGNQQVGPKVEAFWLDGPLEISAVQQVDFLAQLAQRQLPYPQSIQISVQEIIKKDSGKNWILYGKTGWTGSRYHPSIGWFVGWVEQDGKIYSFALNMDIYDASELPNREQIAKESLQAYGLLKYQYSKIIY